MIMPKTKTTKTQAAAKRPAAAKKRVAKKSAVTPTIAAAAKSLGDAIEQRMNEQSPDFIDSCNPVDENQSENAKFD